VAGSKIPPDGTDQAREAVSRPRAGEIGDGDGIKRVEGSIHRFA